MERRARREGGGSMDIGVPREAGRHERRVGLTPWAVEQLVRAGHAVVVEKDAGRGARFGDREYEEAGAKIVYSHEEAYKRADLVCGVSPLAGDGPDLLKPGLVLCGFHHLVLAPRATVDRLRELQITAIGYELVQDGRGRRTILTTMSEMAGEMAVFVAANYLQNEEGGRGILLGQVPGITPTTVLVLGAGAVGRSAAGRALAVGAHVIVLDEDLGRLRAVNRTFGNQIVTQLATPDRLARYTAIADVVIGAILLPGARSPLLITEDMVRAMRAGSVIVDVSIDQGGCVETSRPTTLHDPVFIVHEVVHYCVPNMTANVARTASRVLSDVVLGPVRALADRGTEVALRNDPGLAAGAYLYRGDVTNEQLAGAGGTAARPLRPLLGG
jgi:alanine dehydrogenase